MKTKISAITNGMKALLRKQQQCHQKHCEVQIHDHHHDKTNNVQFLNIPSPQKCTSKHTLDCDIWNLNVIHSHHCHKKSIAYLIYMNRIEECTDPEIRKETARNRPRLDNSMKNDHTYENGLLVSGWKDHPTQNKDKQHNATDLQINKNREWLKGCLQCERQAVAREWNSLRMDVAKWWCVQIKATRCGMRNCWNTEKRRDWIAHRNVDCSAHTKFNKFDVLIGTHKY